MKKPAIAGLIVLVLALLACTTFVDSGANANSVSDPVLKNFYPMDFKQPEVPGNKYLLGKEDLPGEYFFSPSEGKLTCKGVEFTVEESNDKLKITLPGNSSTYDPKGITIELLNGCHFTVRLNYDHTYELEIYQ